MTERIEPTALRQLFHEKVLTGYRHRTAVARRLHLSESEIAALTHLAEGSMTPGELGRRMQLTSGGTTALLHRLDKAGHIARRPHPQDRRSVIISAQPEVLSQIAELFAPLVTDMDSIADKLSPRDRQAIHRYLQHIVAASQRRADELVTDADAADAMPDEWALHLWA